MFKIYNRVSCQNGNNSTYMPDIIYVALSNTTASGDFGTMSGQFFSFTTRLPLLSLTTNYGISKWNGLVYNSATTSTSKWYIKRTIYGIKAFPFEAVLYLSLKKNSNILPKNSTTNRINYGLWGV